MGIEYIAGRPSSHLLKWVDLIASSAPGPILDAPCGKGRNSVPFAARGCAVVCADTDRAALNVIASYCAEPMITGSLRPLEVDLLRPNLPFVPNSFGAVLNVHLVVPSLARRLASLVRPGGFLYVESFENRGGNYLQLPKSGELRGQFPDFEFLAHVEKKAGPRSADAVTFYCLARKR